MPSATTRACFQSTKDVQSETARHGQYLRDSGVRWGVGYAGCREWSRETMQERATHSDSTVLRWCHVFMVSTQAQTYENLQHEYHCLNASAVSCLHAQSALLLLVLGCYKQAMQPHQTLTAFISFHRFLLIEGRTYVKA